MKVVVSFLISFSAAITLAYSQSTFIPKNLGSEINSIYEESNPVISPNGKTLYFTRINHPENAGGIKNSADIWYATLNKDGTTSTAQRLTSLNTGKYNALLSLSEGGNTVLLYIDKSLYTATRNGDTWGAPQKLPVKAAKDASLSNDGNCIVFSKGGKIVLIEKGADGVWGKGKTLVIPSAKKASTPFLLADNKTLYFTAEGKNKQLDIFKTKALSQDKSSWDTATVLNDTINTTLTDSYLKTNLNGSWGYYTSVNSATGKADIFKVKLYEDDPFIEISGTIENAISKRALRHLPVTFLANGKPVDSVKYNSDSATFKIKLPIGKSHSLSARIDHYTEYPVTIDASKIKEYTTLKQNLEEGPEPHVLVKGKLLIKNTGLPIPAKASAAIIVDGDVADHAQVDVENSSYSIKLNHGAVYYVQVSATHFESFPEFVDLSTKDGYEEITLDLQADAEKMAIITGNVIDKKTGKPFTLPAHPQIEVEGVSSVASVVDSLTGAYELRLPLKLAYVISTKVEGYYPVYEFIDVINETAEISKVIDLVAVPVEKGKSVPLNRVAFEAGKATLTADAQPELDKLAQFLVANPKVKVEIGGYTTSANKVSTLNMAKSAVKYLTTKGVAANQLFAKGYGVAKASKDKTVVTAPIVFTFLTGK